MTKEANLTKTCLSCGQLKPLSAFLQMTDEHTINYGNICATCRKTYVEPETEEEDLSRQAVGYKIDSKAKYQLDLNKKIQQEKFEDEAVEENLEKEKELEANNQKTLEQNDDKKIKSRATFLTKTTLLDSKAVQKAAEKVFGGETQKAEEAKVLDPRDTYFGVKEKQKGVNFLNYKKWLGASAPIALAAEQYRAAQKETNAKNTPEKVAEKNIKEKSAPQKFSLATPQTTPPEPPKTHPSQRKPGSMKTR